MNYLEMHELKCGEIYGCEMYSSHHLDLRYLGGCWFIDDKTGVQYTVEGEIRYVNPLGFDWSKTR